jgi:hypothetical protein
MNIIPEQIDIPSAFHLEYREGDHVMKVEMDFRDEFPVLSHLAIRAWEPPFNDEPVSEARKREIMEKIISYLDKARKFKFEVEGGPLAESRQYGQ